MDVALRLSLLYHCHALLNLFRRVVVLQVEFIFHLLVEDLEALVTEIDDATARLWINLTRLLNNFLSEHSDFAHKLGGFLQFQRLDLLFVINTELLLDLLLKFLAQLLDFLDETLIGVLVMLV